MQVAEPNPFTEKAVDLALTPPFSAQQKRLELLALAQHVVGAKRVLEIGVHSCGTLMVWTDVAADDALIVAVDLPSQLDFTMQARAAGMRRPGQRLRVVPADSHAEVTVELIRELGPFDFIFIDGDHSFVGCHYDAFMYGPMLAPGGILAFHDIVKHDAGSGSQVDEVWDLVKMDPMAFGLPLNATYKEYVDLAGGQWGGIGVVLT
jgi:predicted O-methyltransferase YrrM